MKTFQIETQRLILRRFCLADSEQYFHITREPDIRRFVPDACPFDKQECINDIKNIYSKGDCDYDFYLIIENKLSHQIMGAIISVLIHEFDTQYFLASRFRGQGFMSEALSAFIEYMRYTHAGGSILFNVDAPNFKPMWFLENLIGCENITKSYAPDDHDHIFFRYIL